MKRLLDIIVSLFCLALLLPFGLIVAAILRFSGEGQVWYPQQRVGLNGRLFQVFKFVTMRVGSEFVGTKDITIKNDPRVLPIGRILRKSKINELPQFINVLRGDMSLVGWRPLVPASFELYPPHIRERIVAAKPGLTGIGSIVFRDEERILEKTKKEYRQCYREDIAPYKGKLELWYIDNQSIWLDLKILFCTSWVVLFPDSTLYQRLFRDLPQPDAGSEIAVRRRNPVDR
jgi:lipopolysaccharide/colanic/teichoic acid biosynthesis glycosyltransferase